MYQIVQKRKWWYSLSIALSVVSIVYIALGGLKLSIDFTGGTLVQYSFDHRPETTEVVSVVQETGFPDPIVQTLGTNELQIRLGPIEPADHEKLTGALTAKYPDAKELSFEVVGPVIGKELGKKAITAIALVLAGIILYLIWAFRSSGGSIPSWKFGFNAIIALLHDIILTLGLFAALGYHRGVEVDVLFVTALLTILGFSVHDTIVVFDRMREQLRVTNGTIEELANLSVNQTLVRSINTSSTTLFVLLALFLFGGESIRYFVLALLFGITVGTYSSIFIASTLLVTLSRKR